MKYLAILMIFVCSCAEERKEVVLIDSNVTKTDLGPSQTISLIGVGPIKDYVVSNDGKDIYLLKVDSLIKLGKVAKAIEPPSNKIWLVSSANNIAVVSLDSSGKRIYLIEYDTSLNVINELVLYCPSHRIIVDVDLSRLFEYLIVNDTVVLNMLYAGSLVSVGDTLQFNDFKDNLSYEAVYDEVTGEKLEIVYHIGSDPTQYVMYKKDTLFTSLTDPYEMSRVPLQIRFYDNKIYYGNAYEYDMRSRTWAPISRSILDRYFLNGSASSDMENSIVLYFNE